MAKLRNCPFCGDNVDITLSDVQKSYYKISHLCNEGRVYLCITDEDPQVVADTWNGIYVNHYKPFLDLTYNVPEYFGEED